MSRTIVDFADGLKNQGITSAVLKGLDWVVPGRYISVVGFTNMIRAFTGESDEAFIQKVGERAIALYADKSQNYERAVFIYRTVDEIGENAGKLALAGEMTEGLRFLKFLDRLTPKSEKVQTFDFALKAGAEIAAFCQLNGLPGDDIGSFLKSLGDMEPERQMRIACMICIDGILPLGPEFVDKALDGLKGMSAADAERNGKFKLLASALPGGSTGGQLGFLTEGLGSMADWMKGFVSEKGITQSKVLGAVENLVGKSEAKMDYLAAFLDISCRYYEHTGIQSVCRAAITKAVNEV